MIEQVVKTLIHFNEKHVAREIVRTFAKHSNDVEQYNLLAKLAFEIKDYLTASTLAEKVAALLPDSYEAKLNLVNALAHANQPECALALIAEMEAMVPADRDRELKKAYTLFLSGRRTEAEDILRTALANPFVSQRVKTEINFNLGTYDLYNGNFREGLHRFIHYGREMNSWIKPTLPFPKWNGRDDIAGKTVICFAEAGIGDEIINVRFVNHLKNRGATPVWYTERKDVASWFRANEISVATSITEIPGGDIVWCHSMEIPVLLEVCEDDLWQGPYLKPDVSDINKLFNTDSTPKIGLRWEGNPDYDDDLHRSIPIRKVFNEIKDCGAEFYSLQRDTGLEKIDGLPITRLDHALHTFNDAAAAIHECDIVITSCTSIAHAAAAQGIKTYIFVSLSSYYTWCHPGDKSPWYGDNLVLLRQSEPRKWDDQIKQLGALIEKDIRERNI